MGMDGFPIAPRSEPKFFESVALFKPVSYLNLNSTGKPPYSWLVFAVSCAVLSAPLCYNGRSNIAAQDGSRFHEHIRKFTSDSKQKVLFYSWTNCLIY